MAAPSIRGIPTGWENLLVALRSWEQPYQFAQEKKMREKEQADLQTFREGQLGLEGEKVELQREQVAAQKEHIQYQQRYIELEHNIKQAELEIKQAQELRAIDLQEEQIEVLDKQTEVAIARLEREKAELALLPTPEMALKMSENELAKSNNSVRESELRIDYINAQIAAVKLEAQGKEINEKQLEYMFNLHREAWEPIAVAIGDHDYEAFKTAWKKAKLDESVFGKLTEELFMSTSPEVLRRFTQKYVADKVIPKAGLDPSLFTDSTYYNPTWDWNEFGGWSPPQEAPKERGRLDLGKPFRQALERSRTPQEPYKPMEAAISGLEKTDMQKPFRKTGRDIMTAFGIGKKTEGGLFGTKGGMLTKQPTQQPPMIQQAGGVPKTGIEALGQNRVIYNKTVYQVVDSPDPTTPPRILKMDGSEVTDSELKSLIMQEYMKQMQKQ